MAAAEAGGTRRILVAEDSTAGQAVLQKLLTALGFTPVFAGSGREAVAMFVEYPDIALILMDVRMPNLNGIKAAQEIRLAGSGNAMRVPIIGMTAADGPEVRRECLSSGMNEMLVKPLDPRKLVETIRRFLL
ncbi:response regulator [Ferrovibrio xuzhouensis]|uniref:Response regulator n=1 Tax=Ferrovibrio xuzhouensis TaxID=1576914 RepID=A0ABV7VDB1_9PROT